MKKIFIAILLLFQVGLTYGQTRYEVTHLDENINTTQSETGAIVVDDSILLYTTMQTQESSKLYLIDFKPILTHIYQAHLATDGTLGKGKPNTWGLNGNGMNNGNVAYDAKNDVIYFTRSQPNGNSHIYYSRRVNNRWEKAKPLSGDVNLDNYNSTHPSVGYLPDGKVILYFSSDRPGGLGGMDIWYTLIIKEGRPGNCTNLGTPVNSDSNDVTPFYSNEEGILYFSSNRQGGLGGFDIYSAEGQRNSWQLPHTLGNDINGAYDDLFFTMQPCRCRCVLDREDTTEMVEACGFFASNRPESLFKTDSNCCNDLFRWRRLRRPEASKPIVATTTARSALDYLPLSLYFHNDEPNPHTLDTMTTQDYTTSWKRYTQLRDEYKGAQPSPADPLKWDSVQKAVDYFFDYDLVKGHRDMIQFLTFLYEDLKAGHKVCITIDGFASPLFEDLYNVNISKRRINCFRNTLLRWNDEALLPYLNNGSLTLETVAHGAADTNTVAPTDPRRNPKSVRSVYSMEAARDRRIDIIGYEMH